MNKDAEIAEKNPLSRRRVLICDNNKSKYEDLMEALEQASIDSLHVPERAQIVSTALKYQPDLILINLFLNSSNTLAVIRELKGGLERQGTKILVVTAHKSRENIAECIRSGASDFIIEPFDSRQLLQRVKYQLQERESYSPDDLRSEPTQVLAGFQLVYDCLRILSEVKDQHRAVHECLKRVAELSQATRVNVVMADVSTNFASVISSSDDAKLADLKVDLEKYPEVREVCLKGSIVYIKDITANPLTKDIKKAVKSIDITSLLVFPIRHRGDTLGTMSVRLGEGGLSVSDKHLKTFYMVALCLAAKVSARKLLIKYKQQQPASKGH